MAKRHRCEASRRIEPLTSDSRHRERDVLIAVRKVKRHVVAGVSRKKQVFVPPELYGPLVDTNQKSSVTARKTVVVLDTNIMLQHLDLLCKLAWQKSDLNSPTLLIPWIVLQELDSMKGEKRNPRTSKMTKFSEGISDHCIKAKDAVYFINNALKAKAPALLGQSAQQAVEPIRGLVIECNDDRILQCCLQKQRDLAGSCIFLWSNDVNLCTKALLSGIDVCKAEELSNLSSRTKASVSSSNVPQAGKKSVRNPNLTMSKPDAKCCVDIFETFKHWEKTMTDVLAIVMEKEMHLAFDEDWLEIILIQPPWNLQALLKCLDKHWIAVFGFFLPRELQDTVANLRFMLRTGWKPSEGRAILNTLNGSLSLLEALGVRSDYNGSVPQAHEKLTQLVRESQKVLLKPRFKCGQSTSKVLAKRRFERKQNTSKAQNNSSTGSHLPSDQPTQLLSLSQPGCGSTNAYVAGGTDPWVVFEEIWAALLNLTSHLSAVTYESIQVPFEHLHSLTCAVNSLLLSLHRVVLEQGVGDGLSELQFCLLTMLRSPLLSLHPHDVSQASLQKCFSPSHNLQRLQVGAEQLAVILGQLQQFCQAIWLYYQLQQSSNCNSQATATVITS